LAGIATQTEFQNVSAEHIWQLAYLIQKALAGLHNGQFDDFDELTSAMSSNPLLSEFFSSIGSSPETVAIHKSKSTTKPTEVLQRLLLAIESGDLLSNISFRRHALAIDSLKGSVHQLLRASIDFELRQQTIDRQVQRSMYNFAYGLSHEINNPLANISARATSLLGSVEGEREKRSLATIADQAMKAHEMLAEMMLAVQLPSLKLAAGDLRQLGLDLSRTWSENATHRSIVWIDAISDEFLWSAFDRAALSEALSAAIRNSIEACRGGDSISLVAERTESPEGQLEIRIAIIDNGPGLSQHGFERAWDLYFSGREAGRGLGIGLAKVRRIIESHKGRVWLDTKAQQGCTLEIRLPWKRAVRVA